MSTRTQEKGAVTPQETDPDLPVSVQEALMEVWVGRGVGWQWPAAVSGALSVAMHAWDLLKEVFIIFINSTKDLRSNNREGTQTCPSTESWIKDLLSMALQIRTRPRFPLRQSLP